MKTKTKAVKANGGAMSAFVEKTIPKNQLSQIKGGDGDTHQGTDWVGNEDMVDS
ncbi:MAG: hypothetical protein KDC34_08270 [Saprospiraceae bacterium]|nr:hypothetical protein [Saprospiraceae bacterium]